MARMMGALVHAAAAAAALASVPMNHDAIGGPGGTYKVRLHRAPPGLSALPPA